MDDPTLDEAWAEAVAALPLAGWMSSDVDGRWVVPSGSWIIGIEHRPESGDGYFEPHYPVGYVARAQVRGSESRWFVGEDCATPEAALSSLVETLRAETKP